MLKRKTMYINTPESEVELLSKEGKDTLSHLIWDYIAHLEHHLSQLIENYECINPSFVRPH